MLQSIRDRAQGWIAGVIVALIIIPFALWGINSYIDAANAVVVAKVDGEDIELDQFQDALAQFRQQMQAEGQGEALRRLDPVALKNEALEALIRERLIDRYGKANGLRIGDEQLAAQIAATEEFKQDGTFSRELYQQRLRAAGLESGGFERRLRHQMLREQLLQGLSDSSFATQADYQRYARLFGQTRTISYAVLPAAPLEAEVQPDAAQVQTYYEANPATFTTEESVSLAYVELSAEQLAAQVTVEEEALKQYYEANKAAYTEVEQRRGEYVLVPAPKEATPEQVSAAQAKAEDFLEQLRAGRPFSELEGLSSGEDGPRIEVGESGLVRRGMLPAPLEEALFSLEQGALSEVVRSEYGFHLIRVTEIKPGGVRSLQEARQDVEAAYTREQAEKRYFGQAEEMQNLAFEHPDALEPVAEALGLEIKRSDFITRKGGEGVLAEKAVIQAAFAPEVLNDGVNSEPVELEGSRLVVLRLIEHQPSRLRPLEEVRAQIEALLKAEGARERAAARGAALAERLRKGESREALGSAESLEWKTVEKVARQDSSVPRALLRTAFRLGRPAGDQPLYGGVTLANGDYALVAVLAVEDGDPAKIKAEDAKAAREGLAKLYGGQAWEDFLAMLESEADIETYPETLERL